MPTQENSFISNTGHPTGGTNPPLVEVASQLMPEVSPSASDTPQPPKKPQVVFVDQRRKTQIIEIHIEPKSSTEGEVSKQPAEVITANSSENVTALPSVTFAGLDPVADEVRFAVDPFVYEVDGPIPVMPTLPIVESKTSTDQVLAREQSGDHFAWRLLPGPYPAVGNVPQVPVDESIDTAEPDLLQQSNTAEAWTETEVVAENETNDHGDCFYAQSGDVIAIDGNKGFDHIDLRSYSIDDATFQPGAILLHAELETSESGEGEHLPEPITIRHRGVEFAVFKGEVRVELY